jgi:hypothetical protein
MQAVEGGGVNDFPWDSLKRAIWAITGWSPNTQPSPRSPCIPA